MFNWDQIHELPVSNRILNDWESLLNNHNLKERHYHEFLRQTAGLFFTDWDSCIVVSKMKLGSDHETDFVVVRDGYSGGTKYELIEIETPHTQLFDNRGYPTSAFNASLQQVRDWRRWLINDKYQFRQILPTIHTRIIKDSKISFKIIIGRRTEDVNVIEKREQIAFENNVEIISYDRLTDYYKRRTFSNSIWLQSDDMYDQRLMANPFAICLSDSEWRRICKKKSAHIHSLLCRDLLKIRRFNDYYKLFCQESKAADKG